MKGHTHESHLYYQSIENVISRSDGNEIMLQYLWDIVAPTDFSDSAYEEPEYSARRAIFDYFLKTKKYNEGIIFLNKLLLSTPPESININSLLYLRMTDLYLLLGDLTNAESFMNRAAAFPGSDNKGTTVRDRNFDLRDFYEIKIGYAKIIQAKQKYIEASQRFYQISQVNDLPATEQTKCVQEALICAIVGAAGKQRSRLLASFVKDPRCFKLPLYPILEKAYFDRILKSEDRALCKKLIPYAETVLDKAINEHNIMCVSKLFKNIKLEELAFLIGAEKRQAEQLAANMILDGRMDGRINQTSEIIDFESRDNLVAFDKQIEVLLQATNNVVETIQNKYPDWMERYRQASQ